MKTGWQFCRLKTIQLFLQNRRCMLYVKKLVQKHQTRLKRLYFLLSFFDFSDPQEKSMDSIIKSTILLQSNAQRLTYYLNQQKIRVLIMGQTCNGVQTRQAPQFDKENGNTFSTAAPIDQSIIKINLSESRLLQSRASNIKRRNDSLNQTIKMRLSQLPDISRLKKGNYEDDQRIYMDTLKAEYYGEVERGKPNGFGALEFQNGDYLEGEFVDGRCDGKGRYIKSNGSYYEGDLKNNVADGYGKYFDKDGFKYEGQWKNNLPNGRGEAIYPDESRYNGEFLNNRRHGKGVLMQKKCIFQGDFVDNKLEGFATMQNENGESYSGKWKQNEKHGKGEYRWPNGSRYDGEYKLGKREGFGAMYYANGEVYQGTWIDGVKQGEGTYKTLKGTVKGLWRKGDLIEQRK